ncbi:class II aaRS and biotin synthetase [Trametes coccinea BRFM310]|uniref:Class II aaRS and biotin synthetase n=1 Tax=Trametes coccinea (strain BRFM310) TaxID=1353009 RepID=A0A1Y2I5R8_TRAC3|nr:class II aaRS and biotin synthetase [Trametes coccinea BRFM310]
MNVLVYSGPSTSPSSLSHTLSTLRAVLLPNYAVQPVAPQSLATQPWASTCSLLVVPAFNAVKLAAGARGGAMPANAASEVQKYAERGGKVLVLGSAVRVQASRVRVSLAAGLETVTLADDGLLTLTDGESRLKFSVIPTEDSASEAPPGEHASLKLSDGSTLDGLLRSPNAAIDLQDLPDNEAGPTVLARYSSTENTGLVAGVKASVGQGAAAFWSMHLEYSPREEIAASILTKHTSLTSEDLKKAEEGRLRVLRETLSDLGLTLPAQSSSVARPTPQVLTAAAWRSGIVRRILNSLEVSELDSAGDKGYEVKDSNDTFVLHHSSAASRVLAVQGEERYPEGDPATWNPKHIVVFGEGELPPRDFVPRFDLRTYYAALEKARQEHKCPQNYPNLEWGVGEALLYGDVVTSTQTMLDKNMRLLSSLPTPIVSLASSQLTGRGRGGNIWLSPPGCLQFSILLRVPLSALPAPKIVFVQYLFALAVAEACRDPAVLGAEGARVRIKWPNDIYAEMPGTGERKKVGGILVNTSFGAGNVELVIGCGLNVLNPPPIPSLVQLLPPASERHPSMEHTLAAIMARFEPMWHAFVAARGSFEPFMDLYLDRWLHSDQLVTLTTVTPPRKVRIVGITPDHGLLRTMPEREGWGSGQGAEYIDLQPDGNSFDLMAGLIKTKT